MISRYIMWWYNRQVISSQSQTCSRILALLLRTLYLEEFGSDSTRINGYLNTLRPRQNAAISQMTLSSAFSWMKMLEFRLKFFSRGSNKQNPSIGLDNGLAPMMVRLLTHICVTRPQWVKRQKWYRMLASRSERGTSCAQRYDELLQFTMQKTTNPIMLFQSYWVIILKQTLFSIHDQVSCVCHNEIKQNDKTCISII